MTALTATSHAPQAGVFAGAAVATPMARAIVITADSSRMFATLPAARADVAANARLSRSDIHIGPLKGTDHINMWAMRGRDAGRAAS